MEATDEEFRRQKLLDHANQVRTHIAPTQFQAVPGTVRAHAGVCGDVSPGETFFSARTGKDPALIERGVSQKVFRVAHHAYRLAQGGAYGWNQEKLHAMRRRSAPGQRTA